jgi:lipopolysaccharide/colanic/teichoic acid biosynthesis glycosyltransferase
MSKEAAAESALSGIPPVGTAATEEPPGAFIYVPPSAEVLERYRHIFALTEPLPDRFLKTQFDRICALAAIIATAPLFILLYLANAIEGMLIASHHGDFLISYRAVSRGRVFNKYKIRVLKNASMDPAAARAGDWHGFANEWTPGSLTLTGTVVKKFYLDELPQLFNILLGDISMVGPRPLAQHHYEWDLAQGNVARKLIKAGLLGPNQALKGTERFGDAAVEYDYVEKYLTLGPVALLWHDLAIIGRCLMVMAQARGL